MPETSIVVKATDRYSDAVKKMATVTKSFSKDIDGLESTLAALNKNKATLKVDVNKAKDALDEARKAFKATGDEASRLNYEAAQVNLDNVSRNLKAVTREISLTEKEISKLENRASGGSGGVGFGKNIVNALAVSGIGDAAKQLFSEGAQVAVESAFGDANGAIVSNALSSAMSGATAGFMTGGLSGAAVGTIVGGMAGIGSGMLQSFGKKDDAFKSYVQELYEAGESGTQERLSAGSATAGSREQTQMAFAQRLGSDEAARAYLDEVKVMARETNYSYDDITGYSKKLMNSYSAQETLGVLMKLSDATAGLDLSSSDVDMFISGLSRMRLTGKATAEYLNYFSERGLDVYTAISEATGWDKPSVAERVTKGDLKGDTAAQAILDYIDRTYGGLSEKLAGTYDAMTDNLEDTMADVNAAMGEGYNDSRVTGIAAEIEAYGGELGEALAGVNRVIGENKAMLENLSEQYTREGLSALLLGTETTVYSPEDAGKLAEMREEYVAAQEAYTAGSAEAGLKMESLTEQARALATSAYEASEQYQAVQETELDQIQAIRDNTSELSALTGYLKSQELSRGRMARTDYSISGVSYSEMAKGPVAGYDEWGNPYAVGLSYVPYDNFPALLHQGERVLTAQEARSQGDSRTVEVTGNQFIIREDADVDRIAAALLEYLEMAEMRG